MPTMTTAIAVPLKTVAKKAINILFLKMDMKNIHTTYRIVKITLGTQPPSPYADNQ